MPNIHDLTHHFFKKNDAISLEQIKNFMCIYELGSMSLTANAMYKTQPAISHSINKLEEKINIKLLHRNRGKTISFTEEGHRFYENISPILSTLLFQLDEVTHRDTVSIGVCDEIPADIQQKIVQEIQQETGKNVRLLCDFSIKIQEMVDDGRLSFGIRKKINHKNLQTSHQFIWVGSQSIQFDDIDKLAIVTAHTGCINRHLLENTLYKVGKNYDFSYLNNHLHSQAEMILIGMGIGILDKIWLDIYPSLICLDKTNGFPELPSFIFECIGHADNFTSTTIQERLIDITKELNTHT